jgi:hypothetical protein
VAVAHLSVNKWRLALIKQMVVPVTFEACMRKVIVPCFVFAHLKAVRIMAVAAARNETLYSLIAPKSISLKYVFMKAPVE